MTAPRFRWVLRVTLLVLTATALACSGGGDDATGTTSTTSPETTSSTASASSTTSVADAEAQVQSRYLAYWDMYLRVNDPPAPNDPAITDLTTGPALPALLDIINANASQGLVFRAPANSVSAHHVEVTSVDGSTAELTDCGVDDSQVVRAATGEVVNGDVVTKLIDATLVLEGGVWKVSDYIFKQRWEGVAGCAVSS